MVSDLDVATIQSLLETQRYGRVLHVMDAVDSTNDLGKEAIRHNAAAGTVFVADAQRLGRGSRGRSWVSPAGTDLYLSVIDTLPLQPEHLPPLTLAVGLALAECVEHFAQQRALVKWPNDVYIHQRKCAGVLVESVIRAQAQPAMVIGIGLNVNRTAWPADLEASATSLIENLPTATHQREPLARAQVLAKLLGYVEQRVQQFAAGFTQEIIGEVNARLALVGQRVRVEDCEGIVQGIHPSGALLLNVQGTCQQIRSGTLTLPAYF